MRIEIGETGRHERRLADEQGRALARSGVVTAVPSPFEAGVWELTARRAVGVARLGGVELWITPKVPVRRLLFLLGYARDPQTWRDEDVDVADAPELLPAVAHALARQVERALRGGLLAGYRRVDETAQVLRGRLRETAQLRRHHGRPLPLEIRRDVFTVDTAENRILLAAITRMLAVPGLQPAARRRLAALRIPLADVTSPVRGTALPAWTPTRLNERYHVALRLAEIVWAATSPEHSPGATTSNGFLVDLARAFEDFLVTALREVLRGDGVVRTPLAAHLDHASRLLIKPDLVWLRDGTPIAVVDAKYKQERPAGYPEADVYQMLAYCTALRLPRGHLVYARGGAEPARHTVLGSGVEIHCHALDLDVEPAALLAQVDRLGGELRDGARSATVRLEQV